VLIESLRGHAVRSRSIEDFALRGLPEWVVTRSALRVGELRSLLTASTTLLGALATNLARKK